MRPNRGIFALTLCALLVEIPYASAKKKGTTTTVAHTTPGGKKTTTPTGGGGGTKKSSGGGTPSFNQIHKVAISNANKQTPKPNNNKKGGGGFDIGKTLGDIGKTITDGAKGLVKGAAKAIGHGAPENLHKAAKTVGQAAKSTVDAANNTGKHITDATNSTLKAIGGATGISNKGKKTGHGPFPVTSVSNKTTNKVIQGPHGPVQVAKNPPNPLGEAWNSTMKWAGNVANKILNGGPKFMAAYAASGNSTTAPKSLNIVNGTKGNAPVVPNFANVTATKSGNVTNSTNFLNALNTTASGGKVTSTSSTDLHATNMSGTTPSGGGGGGNPFDFLNKAGEAIGHWSYQVQHGGDSSIQTQSKNNKDDKTKVGQMSPIQAFVTGNLGRNDNKTAKNGNFIDSFNNVGKTLGKLGYAITNPGTEKSQKYWSKTAIGQAVNSVVNPQANDQGNKHGKNDASASAGAFSGIFTQAKTTDGKKGNGQDPNQMSPLQLFLTGNAMLKTDRKTGLIKPGQEVKNGNIFDSFNQFGAQLGKVSWALQNPDKKAAQKIFNNTVFMKGGKDALKNPTIKALYDGSSYWAGKGDEAFHWGLQHIPLPAVKTDKKGHQSLYNADDALNYVGDWVNNNAIQPINKAGLSNPITKPAFKVANTLFEGCAKDSHCSNYLKFAMDASIVVPGAQVAGRIGGAIVNRGIKAAVEGGLRSTAVSDINEGVGAANNAAHTATTNAANNAAHVATNTAAHADNTAGTTVRAATNTAGRVDHPAAGATNTANQAGNVVHGTSARPNIAEIAHSTPKQTITDRVNLIKDRLGPNADPNLIKKIDMAHKVLTKPDNVQVRLANVNKAAAVQRVGTSLPHNHITMLNPKNWFGGRAGYVPDSAGNWVKVPQATTVPIRPGTIIDNAALNKVQIVTLAEKTGGRYLNPLKPGQFGRSKFTTIEDGSGLRSSVVTGETMTGPTSTNTGTSGANAAPHTSTSPSGGGNPAAAAAARTPEEVKTAFQRLGVNDPNAPNVRAQLGQALLDKKATLQQSNPTAWSKAVEDYNIAREHADTGGVVRTATQDRYEPAGNPDPLAGKGIQKMPDKVGAARDVLQQKQDVFNEKMALARAEQDVKVSKLAESQAKAGTLDPKVVKQQWTNLAKEYETKVNDIYSGAGQDLAAAEKGMLKAIDKNDPAAGFGNRKLNGLQQDTAKLEIQNGAISRQQLAIQEIENEKFTAKSTADLATGKSTPEQVELARQSLTKAQENDFANATFKTNRELGQKLAQLQKEIEKRGIKPEDQTATPTDDNSAATQDNSATAQDNGRASGEAQTRTAQDTTPQTTTAQAPQKIEFPELPKRGTGNAWKPGVDEDAAGGRVRYYVEREDSSRMIDSSSGQPMYNGRGSIDRMYWLPKEAKWVEQESNWWAWRMNKQAEKAWFDKNLLPDNWKTSPSLKIYAKASSDEGELFVEEGKAGTETAGKVRYGIKKPSGETEYLDKWGGENAKTASRVFNNKPDRAWFDAERLPKDWQAPAGSSTRIASTGNRIFKPEGKLDFGPEATEKRLSADAGTQNPAEARAMSEFVSSLEKTPRNEAVFIKAVHTDQEMANLRAQLLELTRRTGDEWAVLKQPVNGLPDNAWWAVRGTKVPKGWAGKLVQYVAGDKIAAKLGKMEDTIDFADPRLAPIAQESRLMIQSHPIGDSVEASVADVKYIAANKQGLSEIVAQGKDGKMVSNMFSDKPAQNWQTMVDKAVQRQDLSAFKDAATSGVRLVKKDLIDAGKVQDEVAKGAAELLRKDPTVGPTVEPFVKQTLAELEKLQPEKEMVAKTESLDGNGEVTQGEDTTVQGEVAKVVKGLEDKSISITDASDRLNALEKDLHERFGNDPLYEQALKVVKDGRSKVNEMVENQGQARIADSTTSSTTNPSSQGNTGGSAFGQHMNELMDEVRNGKRPAQDVQAKLDAAKDVILKANPHDQISESFRNYVEVINKTQDQLNRIASQVDHMTPDPNAAAAYRAWADKMGAKIAEGKSSGWNAASRQVASERLQAFVKNTVDSVNAGSLAAKDGLEGIGRVMGKLSGRGENFTKFLEQNDDFLTSAVAKLDKIKRGGTTGFDTWAGEVASRIAKLGRDQDVTIRGLTDVTVENVRAGKLSRAAANKAIDRIRQELESTSDKKLLNEAEAKGGSLDTINDRLNRAEKDAKAAQAAHDNGTPNGSPADRASDGRYRIGPRPTDPNAIDVYRRYPLAKQGETRIEPYRPRDEEVGAEERPEDRAGDEANDERPRVAEEDDLRPLPLEDERFPRFFPPLPFSGDLGKHHKKKHHKGHGHGHGSGSGNGDIVPPLADVPPGTTPPADQPAPLPPAPTPPPAATPPPPAPPPVATTPSGPSTAILATAFSVPYDDVLLYRRVLGHQGSGRIGGLWSPDPYYALRNSHPKGQLFIARVSKMDLRRMAKIVHDSRDPDIVLYKFETVDPANVRVAQSGEMRELRDRAAKMDASDMTAQNGIAVGNDIFGGGGSPNHSGTRRATATQSGRAK